MPTRVVLCRALRVTGDVAMLVAAQTNADLLCLLDPLLPVLVHLRDDRSTGEDTKSRLESLHPVVPVLVVAIGHVHLGHRRRRRVPVVPATVVGPLAGWAAVDVEALLTGSLSFLRLGAPVNSAP